MREVKGVHDGDYPMTVLRLELFLERENKNKLFVLRLVFLFIRITKHILSLERLCKRYSYDDSIVERELYSQ